MRSSGKDIEIEDALKLDWANEMLEYLSNNPGYKVHREKVSDDEFEYTIRDRDGYSVFSVISSRSVFTQSRHCRRRRRKRR